MVYVQIKIESDYKKYVVYEGSKKVLCVWLCKALYGTLHAALLSWKKLSLKLQEWEFKMNP
jgi:hypothetical protein